MNQTTHKFTIEPLESSRHAELCGACNNHLKQVGDYFQIKINNREQNFELIGSPEQCQLGEEVLRNLYTETQKTPITPEIVHLFLQESGAWQKHHADQHESIKTKRLLIKPRGWHQQGYIQKIRSKDINFGVGPAGTGKTYLAVACAVEALEKEQVKRILLVRPAVEAGEKLGFLPGDLAQKVDPYLRPLYDALYDMLGFELVDKLLAKNVIEVAPLAYMRGRTLNNSFIILDESQNTTSEQMKMFLTRIGFGSSAVITGDTSQIDLPCKTSSGLTHALQVLVDIKGIGITYFTSKDVVRHLLVQHIVEAYDKHEKEDEKPKNKTRQSKKIV